MQQESYKYWAFISYSHRDQAWADWLHKALETYRVPRRLVGRETAAGPVPRRLFPVFRDLEELPSSPNLSGAIDQALQQSRYLIVIASPYAAVSKWVDQEIARFRAMGRGDRILCLIVDGEPHADLHPGKGFLECFPPSLRAGDGIEPIAADVRPGKDGKPATKLKLIAGLLGVGLDELRRRERRRRILQSAVLFAIGLLSAIVLTGLWQLQQREKREALAQQALHTHIETVYERGREELLAHNEARAAVYLNEAYRLGVNTPAMRFMLGRAMRIVESQRISFQTGAPVTTLRFSPDSKSLVTTSADGVARLWDTATGARQLEIPLPHSSGLFSPSFSRDSRLIYYRTRTDRSATGLISVWEISSGRLRGSGTTQPNFDRTFNPFDWNDRHIAYVTSDRSAEISSLDFDGKKKILPGSYSVAGFSRDGRRLLTGTENGEVAIWDQQGSRKLRVLPGLSTRVVSLDDSEDGKLLAASAQDGTVRVWQTADGTPRLVAGHPSPNPGLVFNIDGTRLLTWAADGDRVWNTTSGALVYVQQSSAATGKRMDISSSGRWVLTSSSSRLLMQDAQSGADLFTLDGHRGLPGARDISEDDRMLATGGPDGRVVIWNMPKIPDGELLHSVDPLRWATQPRAPGVAAIFSHDGKLIATGAGDGSLKLWSAKTHELIRSVAADVKSVNVVKFSDDDRFVITGGEADGLKMWSVETGAPAHAFSSDGRRILTAMISSDGRMVAASMLGGITRIWDINAEHQIASFDRDEALAGSFSPDSGYFAVGASGTVKLWDIARKEFIWSVQLTEDAEKASDDVAAIDFSSNGAEILAACAGGGAVFVLDAHDGHILRKVYQPSSGQITTARFDSKGDLAVMGNHDAVATLWRPLDGQLLSLRGHAGMVRSAIFSPDDAFVLTGGVDATARLWDSRNGELLDTIAEHSREMPEVPFQAANFSPDGHWVITGSTDGVIRLWELREESRSSQQIETILRCQVPWKLDGDELIASDSGIKTCKPGEASVSQ